MSCVEGDLRKVIFNGKNKIEFKIPNYCICDPIFERDYDEIKKMMKILLKKILLLLYVLGILIIK